MKLTIFQSGPGDCLLLTSSDDRRMLIDGGFVGTFREHVRKHLSDVAGENGIDVLCVSHIDEDHIAGILQLLQDLIDWRVYDHHKDQPDSNLTDAPRFPRPPEIAKIWHNGFKDVSQQNNLADIEELLILNMRAFGTTSETHALAEQMQFLATSVRQGLKLQHQISEKLLNIPLNPEYGGGLMFVPDPQETFSVGNMKTTLVGPFKEDLDALRDEWNDWIDDNKSKITKLKEWAKDQQRRFRLDEGEIFKRVLREFALSGQKRGKVTVPNLASLMMYVEDADKKVLLTGDGRDDEILDGLWASELWDEGQPLHLDILKIQHHGSINNVNANFCKNVIADHYVICGGSGGTHKNPDTEVLDMIVNSRTGTASQKSTHAKVNDHFTLWFSSNNESGGKSANKHMKAVMKHIHSKEAASNGRFDARFMPKNRHFMEIEL